MLLARMITPITTLGPGNRVGIWTQGCTKRCKGCMSGELQTFDQTKDIPVDLLISIIVSEARRNKCRGITISGGDPLEQSEQLYFLLKGLRSFFTDVLVYTGYTMDEINNSDSLKRCLQYMDVLVDGRYIERENTGRSKIYGSNNQKIYFFNKKLVKDYRDYEGQECRLESFIHNDKVITVGIQKRDYTDEE
jgi:anaerobic ribonucleoside-triphosphate reductase activating protein